MLRFAPSTVVVVILAIAHLAFANPPATTVTDQIQVAAYPKELPARPAPAPSSSSDATTPANSGYGNDIVPFGCCRVASTMLFPFCVDVPLAALVVAPIRGPSMPASSPWRCR
jgi:hypothetical protein